MIEDYATEMQQASQFEFDLIKYVNPSSKICEKPRKIKASGLPNYKRHISLSQIFSQLFEIQKKRLIENIKQSKEGSYVKRHYWYLQKQVSNIRERKAS